MRGIAILFTLFHHIAYYLVIHPNKFFTDLYSNFTFWAGVDLFFAISGFVIMNSFLKTLRQKNITIWKACKIFWVKRIFRILPAAWFWLLIYLLFTVYFNAVGAFGNISENLQDAKVAVLQYANIYGVSCWGDAAQAQCGPNGIYWSLSLEEQFYILLPLLFLVFRNYFKYFLMVGIFFLFFLNRPEWSWGWALRTDAIMLGVLISILYENNKTQVFRFLDNKIFMNIFVLLSLFLMAYLPAKPNHISVSTGLVAIICALLVWIASFEKGYLFNNLWIKKTLVWFGSRSYSIYLIHVIIFRLSYEIFYQLSPVGYKILPEQWPILLLISMPILLLVSELSYRFIEIPTRNLGIKLTSRVN